MVDELDGVANQGGIPDALDGEQRNPADGTPVGSTKTIDWDSDENPYKVFKSRYDGIQGTFKQVKQQNEQLLAERMQMTERMAVAQAEAQGMSPEEIERVRQAVRGQNAMALLAEQLKGEREAMGSERAALEELAKPIVLQRIAKQYGIDPELIADAPDPQTADFLAKKFAQYGKKETVKARQQAGVDEAEEGGAGPTSWKDLDASSKIARGVELAIAQASRRR